MVKATIVNILKQIFFSKPINDQLKEIQEEAVTIAKKEVVNTAKKEALKAVASVKKPRKPAGLAKERVKKNHK